MGGLPGLDVVDRSSGFSGIVGQLGRDVGFSVAGAAVKHRGAESVHRGSNLGGGLLVVTTGKESGLVEHAGGDPAMRTRAGQCRK